MFEKIGDKIKTLAIAIFWLGVIASVIMGIDSAKGAGFIPGLTTFLLTAGIGSLVSWVSCFVLYGFGEIIDKVTEIAENTKKDNANNDTINENQDNNNSNTL